MCKINWTLCRRKDERKERGLLPYRVGTSPIFWDPSRAQALSIVPERAQACPNFPQACFEPELVTYRNLKIQARACLELFWKLGLLSLGFLYCKPKIRPGPQSPSPGSCHLYWLNSPTLVLPPPPLCTLIPHFRGNFPPQNGVASKIDWNRFRRSFFLENGLLNDVWGKKDDVLNEPHPSGHNGKCQVGFSRKVAGSNSSVRALSHSLRYLLYACNVPCTLIC